MGNLKWPLWLEIGSWSPSKPIPYGLSEHVGMLWNKDLKQLSCLNSSSCLNPLDNHVEEVVGHKSNKC